MSNIINKHGWNKAGARCRRSGSLRTGADSYVVGSRGVYGFQKFDVRVPGILYGIKKRYLRHLKRNQRYARGLIVAPLSTGIVG